MNKKQGYVLVLVAGIMALLFSNLYLSFTILRNRIKITKEENFKKKEKKNLVKIIQVYEKKKINDEGINYLVGETKLWTLRDGISQGYYKILKIVKDYETIYKMGDGIIPSEKMYLNNSSSSKYKIYLIKTIQLKEIEVEITIIIQVEYKMENLIHNVPDDIKFVDIAVEFK